MNEAFEKWWKSTNYWAGEDKAMTQAAFAAGQAAEREAIIKEIDAMPYGDEWSLIDLEGSIIAMIRERGE